MTLIKLRPDFTDHTSKFYRFVNDIQALMSDGCANIHYHRGICYVLEVEEELSVEDLLVYKLKYPEVLY